MMLTFPQRGRVSSGTFPQRARVSFPAASDNGGVMHSLWLLALLALSVASSVILPAQSRATAPQGPGRVLVGREFEATVVRVADGDTLEVTAVGQPQVIRIRLQGIDAPELGEVFSGEAQR